MSGLAHKAEQKVEQVKDKFYNSGDRGTTGRENFEDGTPLVPAGGNTGTTHGGLTGNHGHEGHSHGLGSGVTGGHTGTGSGLTGAGHTGTGSGLTGSSHTGGLTDSHNTGSGLTGSSHTGGLTGSQNTGSGLTGSSHTGGLTGSHNTGSGLTGSGHNHGLSNENSARSDLGQTHGSSGTGTGLAAAAGAVGSGHGHHGHSHGTAGDNYNTVGNESRGTGSALHTLGGGENTTSTGLTGGDSHRGHEHGIGGGHRNEGTHNTAAALGAGAVGSGAGHHDHSHSHTGQGKTGLDKVGSLDQNSSLYERTGESGPATTGAAGTDRFDTGKHHTGGLTGTTGHNTSTGLPEGEGRKEHGIGGIGGVLGTSDKDFLNNRDRIATGGAYNDDHKHFQNNTSGPGGNTALTGREGTNKEFNPVAQAQSAGTGTGGLSHGTHGQGVHDTHEVDEHGNPKKKSIIEKVKDAIL